MTPQKTQTKTSGHLCLNINKQNPLLVYRNDNPEDMIIVDSYRCSHAHIGITADDYTIVRAEIADDEIKKIARRKMSSNNLEVLF